MLLNPKKSFLYLISIIVLAAIAVVVLNIVAKRKIESFISDKFPNKTLQYENLKVEILFNHLQISGISYANQEIEAELNNLEINNLDYWKLLMHDVVDIEKISIDRPKIILFEHSEDSSKTAAQKGAADFFIHTFKVKDGSFLYLNQKKDTIFSAENYSIKIGGIDFKDQVGSAVIPFEYEEYSGNVKNVYFDMNAYHYLQIDRFSFSNENFVLDELNLLPKYSRAEMREIIPYEKDMYTLNIPSVKINLPQFEFVAGHPVFKAALLKIEGADFEIYRDKTVTDDVRQKKMYSEMLRDLKLKLAIYKVELSNTFIQYQERLKPGRSLGTVAFYDLSAEIFNLTNQHLNDEIFPTTKIAVRTKFMNTTDLKVNWEFKINDTQDKFTISGNAGNIPPESINSFFVPALNIKAEGNLDALYFNFAGNKVRAHGDLRIDYDNFTVTVLKKDGKEKNKLLSAIANIFVKRNPKNGTITTNGVSVTRDQTKSFWNYFWSCIKKGLKKSMV